MSHKNSLSVIILLSLSACGWVDSTGQQDSELPVLVDPSLVVLRNGDSLTINENSQKTVVFSNADNRVANWNWKRLDGQADIQRCSAYSNFDRQNAHSTLNESCANSASCDLRVEETSIDNITRFQLTTPQMRAPAALEYRLTARASDGRILERTQLICAIPVNDAPDANDDRYTVMRSTALEVEGNSDRSLLFNDKDDTDVRNKALRVLTNAETMPRFADDFELYEDGGFLYIPKPNAPLSSNGSVSDRFTYTVTDGSGTSTATALIKITDFNTAPTQTATLPEVQADIWEQNEIPTHADFSMYFSDAQNDDIKFVAIEDSLPESGNIYLSDDGRLQGIPEATDSGRYFVKLAARDEFDSVDAGFYLNIVRTNGVNKAPYANDISNATVRNDFFYDITVYFGDANDDNLTFTATGLPDGVVISHDGIISGTVDDGNRGNAFVRVTANDGHGGTANDGFRLSLRK